MVSFIFISACSSIKKVPKEELNFRFEATARPYVAALGSGRGVVFNLSMLQPALPSSDIQIDSFIVNGKRTEVAWQENTQPPLIQANYFVPEPMQDSGATPMPEINSPDPIIYLSQYEPATLYLQVKGEAHAVPITSIKRLIE
ncbi:MAG: hypothetical protein LPK45_00330 [Bacteroidota bacterium]|nr:hypothetical protein [Bacteroidota bacterium]MDX5429466.1 hypothetical protein [Bacteroidota bacterium]MDX5468258.1 hypothetical protein [Bacteroidota bacterium]